MKKMITLTLFLCIVCASSAQVKNDFIQKNSTGKSLVVLNIDSVNSNEIENIKNNLDHFYWQNKKSHIFIGVGLAFYGLAMLSAVNNLENVKTFSIISASSGLLGTVIYLDSYKWLKRDRKKKLKNKII